MKKFIQLIILTALLYFFMVAFASAQTISSHGGIIFPDAVMKKVR
jgi:hypothetical protein